MDGMEILHELRSISIPSIATGAFVYPIRFAAPIALKTIIQFLETEQHSLDEVRMVLYTREDDNAYTIFAHALEQILSERVSDGSAKVVLEPPVENAAAAAAAGDWRLKMQRSDGQQEL